MMARIEQWRLDRMNSMIAEGRILRGEWMSTDEDGTERACLLAALSPEAGEEQDHSACPAEVMSTPLAALTPCIDDEVSSDAWPDIVRRYAALAHRWHVLTAADWRRLDYQWRLVALHEALPHDTHGVVQPVIDLCQRAANGESIPAATWASACGIALGVDWAIASTTPKGAWSAVSDDMSSDDRGATCDRMATAILDRLESAIAEREGAR